MPIPAKGTICGLLTPGVLSVIFRVSVCGPTAVGANLTVIVQLEPDASVEPQVFDVIANCVPVAKAMDEIDRLPVFVFDKVIACPAELVLIP